ncbi:VOC family protein [Undibacterium amnicola]|uniref:VOC family protein n=1 Tax=Undibacterium amnicola TaxID=1834038 RepID=A0ABR6XS64_9BURK|nr:VOC family protein [Undibacterium amnicola]MBC3832319.1 VOC family protein [Undibacterium amnicola]
MSIQALINVTSVVPVKDFEASFSWYQTFFGREPDVVPMEGIAEWQFAENAWVQVSVDPDRAGSTSVALCVKDVEAQRTALTSLHLAVGEIVEYPDIIKMVEIVDPDGNKISFVQNLSNGSGS